MTEVSIGDAFRRISKATSEKEREAGLAEFKHVLNYHRNKARAEGHEDSLYQEGFSRFAEVISSLRTTFLQVPKPKKNNAKSMAAKAQAGLSSCAAAMRLTVEGGVRQMRYKTMRMLLDHIIQVLPSVTDGYFEPIATDYVKCLLLILEYQPHVEHLTKKEWISIVGFCLDGISNFSPASQPASGIHSNGTPRTRTPDPSAESVARSSIRESGVGDRHGASYYGLVDDLVACLRHLASATNAPLQDQAHPILLNLATWLLSPRPSLASAHVDAFAAINSVLSTTHLDSTSVMQQAIRHLLPIMRNFWSTKLPSLKDEMLTTLIFSRAQIPSMLRSTRDDGNDLRSGLENLLELMHSDYVKRVEREQLQIDDLRLRCAKDCPLEQPPFSLSAFRLKSGNARSEHSWALLYFMAYLSNVLDSSRPIVDRSFELDDGDVASKRLRTSDYLHDYLRQLSSPHHSAKICALQTITFIVQQVALSVEDIRIALEKLTAKISDGNTAISNWAMLGTTSCAMQLASASPELSSLWATVWQLSSRNISTSSSCRVAAHAMDTVLRLGLVDYSTIAEAADAMITSTELHGPAVLSETSCSLWLTVLDARTSESPHSSQLTTDRMLRWLFSKWTPSNFHDRWYTSHGSHNYEAWDIVRVLCVSTDRVVPPHQGRPFSSLGPLAIAWLNANQCPQLTSYLLRSEKSNNYLAEPKSIIGDASSLQHRRSIPADRVILDFCVSEVEKTTQRFKEYAAERIHSLSTEMLRTITILCLVTSQFSTAKSSAQFTRTEDIERVTEILVKALASLVARRDCDQIHVDAVIEAVAPSLPRVDSLNSLDAELFNDIGITSLILHLAGALESRRKARDFSRSGASYDPMDIDDDFDSQASNRPSKGEVLDFPRSNLIAEMSPNCLRATTAATMFLLASALDMESTSDSNTSLPRAFLDHMTSLSASDFIARKQLVVDLLSSSLHVTTEDGEELLEYAATRFLQSYEHERSEVAIGLCVQLLTGTASSWTDSSSSAYNLGADIYEWLIKKPLKAGAASPYVQILIAKLFQKLLQVQPEYAKDLQLPSVRTSLLSVLQDGNILVKYYIIDSLSEIFGFFVLSQHDAIFEDVHESLPKDQNSVEEMALRLLALARLGSAWHTLLRRCVYHIFEAAGVVQESVGHAAYCIRSVSDALHLGSPQALFRLFAPQMLYTWLDPQTLEGIPYSIFGYESLALLLEDVQDEVYGQLVMRDKKDDIQALVQQLHIPQEQVAIKNFAKAAAYAVAYDVSHGHGRNKSIPSRESTLRKLLGDDTYAMLMRQQFPCILGIFISTIERVDLVERVITKFPEFKYVEDKLQEMRDISSSDATLPTGQQPSFPAKYIWDEIKRLCRRTVFDATKFWTADCFTYVMRFLLNKIHPALGSLQACSVIRKIRFLIALAGRIALEGYPLQMTLSALRPFLTDSQCADDAFGIVRYLFHHGKPHLQNQLSFVAGNSLSILISLRVFLSSSQDSTTQESRHVATMQKATSFHRWFITYLESYIREVHESATSRNDKSSKNSLELFHSMVRAACEVRTTGNAIKGSPESSLLLALLKDESNDRKLLDEPSQDLAYSLLCRQFQLPPSFQEDILGSTDSAAKFALQVWKSGQRSTNSDQYLLWVARVLGRSYSACGEVQESLRRTARGNGGANLRSRNSKTSRMSIVEYLASLLQGDQPYKTGLAEHTLRAILATEASVEQLKEVEQVLPLAVQSGLTTNEPFEIPLLQPKSKQSIEDSAFPKERKEVSVWIADLCISLAESTPQDKVVSVLPRFLSDIPSSAEQMFPYILHLALEREFEADQTVKETISDAYRKWFQQCGDDDMPYVKILLRSVLYLRTQGVPNGRTIADRIQWLDIDYLEAAHAAVKCGMHRAALLLAETHSRQPVRNPRRLSVLPQQQTIPLQLQLAIYKNLDEPDSFYGVEQEPSLASVLGRLDYESDGFKGLLFHGVKMDSQMRRLKTISPSDSRGIVKGLTMLNLNSVTHALLSNDDFRDPGHNLNYTLEVAQKLEQWDIRAPAAKKFEAAAVYKAYQGLSNSTDLITVRKHLDQSYLETIRACVGSNTPAQTLQSSFRTLAVLNEIDDIMSSSQSGELLETWNEIRKRGNWMKEARIEDFRPILSSRETLFSVLGKSPQLQQILHTGPKHLREREVEALNDAAEMFRRHGSLQESLASATYLADIVPSCQEVGLDIELSAKFQVASVLWDQGEKTTSIRMLQQLEENRKAQKQDHAVPRLILLTKLGHHTAEARLKKPEEIMKQYMEPAIQELKSNNTGSMAGHAYHSFATFCDQQLQSQDLIDDQTRMSTLAERREADAQEYEKMAKTAKHASTREYCKKEAKKSRKWYNMDVQEAQRLGDSRVAFLRQSLENYLLGLQACDDYDNDVFRMFALWFEYSHLPLANNVVSKHIEPVPSGKFVVLMNQICSRLQAEKSDFQQILNRLVFRICVKHPYHGMHHIFSGSMGGSSLKDETAKSRNAAAKDIGRQLKTDRRAGSFWEQIQRSNSTYHEMATFTDHDFKPGRDFHLDKYPLSKKMLTTIPSLKVPPITLQIPVRNDGDYSRVPRITGFRPTMGIANGLSQPKVVTAIAADGRNYKQLYKSGNDDLRQDAIMEQVFEHVSQLLRSHTATRLRNLHIRTYRVVPLSPRSGAIEFVQNTVPMMNFLDYAHQAYYPKDWKQTRCREKINGISGHTQEERLKAYREVCRNFNPVLRYFFLERFEDPDDWFEKRLAYTRSTAAISILGHVLGLGDRHCHNILLDQQSGEAVHIDLGVAFEAGRILPVPEVVPFRLTRDIIDAMGYTGVEGVFRRCCEFTLDTLRDERDSIMTILNVLRYDPLYSWSLSPFKAKKMQEEQGQGQDASGDVGALEEQQLLQMMSKKKDDDEVGDAGRALSLVERKLSKALSSTAAVNELIQQATDERNLAVLYAGWSAWC